MKSETTRRLGMIVLAGLAFASIFAGCSSVTSHTGTMASGPGGAFWFVRDGWASSRIFYCPPETRLGRHRCVEAEVVDEGPLLGAPLGGARPSGAQPMPARQPRPAVAPAPAPAVAPAPATPAAPRPAGCTSDWDCKAGRACRNGACVEP